jgi:1-acyl-sn-glycerol-3-phosphate acyltransferase
MRPGPAATYSRQSHGANRRLAAWVALGYEYAVLYGGLLLFAALLAAWSPVAALAGLVLPHRLGVQLGQHGIMVLSRGYLFALSASRLFKFDLEALDALRDERSLIIAPNHPSLLDVILMASRLPRAVCIIKSELGDNFLLNRAARLAGYVRNDSTVWMVRQACDSVRAGGQLLIFPEGTRTSRKPVDPFKGGFALIAKVAGVPVQTVFIETDSPFLGKGWPLFRKPAFPLSYRAKLGRRFDVNGEVKTFVAEMEGYYRETLRPADRVRTSYWDKPSA